jgi:hypothetical protein
MGPTIITLYDLRCDLRVDHSAMPVGEIEPATKDGDDPPATPDLDLAIEVPRVRSSKVERCGLCSKGREVSAFIGATVVPGQKGQSWRRRRLRLDHLMIGC